MTIPTPVEFWTLNNTRVGAVGGLPLIPHTEGDYYTAGKIEQGWQFNNSIGRTLRCQSDLFTPADEITVACWYRRPDTTNEGARYVLSLGNDDGTEFVVFQTDKLFTGVNRFVVLGGGFNKTVVSMPANTNWHHWVASIKVSTGTLDVWIDGIKYQYSGITFNPSGQNSLFVGGSRWPTPLLTIRGDVDCVGFWNVCLTDAEVAELYNSGNGWEYTLDDESSDSSSSSSVSSQSSSSTSSGSSESSSSDSSSQSSESSESSTSSSSDSSSQSTAIIDLPRSCTITVTGSFSFTAVVEKPT